MTYFFRTSFFLSSFLNYLRKPVWDFFHLNVYVSSVHSTLLHRSELLVAYKLDYSLRKFGFFFLVVLPRSLLPSYFKTFIICMHACTNKSTTLFPREPIFLIIFILLAWTTLSHILKLVYFVPWNGTWEQLSTGTGTNCNMTKLRNYKFQSRKNI